MKHIFYICQDASDSLGLEKILSFYNIVSLEKNDAVEDLINSGVSVMISDDISSKDTQEFVENLSYGEKPYILSSNQSAIIKISQLYDWTIASASTDSDNIPSSTSNIVRFSVYKNEEKKVFGNIHKLISTDLHSYNIETLDWSCDYIKEVSNIVDSLNDLQNGFTTVECKIQDDGTLLMFNKYVQLLSEGINVYTNIQIMNDESPFVLYTIYDDVEKEDKLSFTENFVQKNPISQSRPYDYTLVNIKSKFEQLIKNDLPSGVWKYGGDSTGKFDKSCLATYLIDEDGDKTLCLLHRGYSLYDVVGSEGMVICTRQKGTSLTSNDIMGTIKIPGKAVDGNNNLYGWVIETINAILNNQMK
ncbi:MAG: hypothetical protein WCJ19_05555 [bacterium]